MVVESSFWGPFEVSSRNGVLYFLHLLLFWYQVELVETSSTRYVDDYPSYKSLRSRLELFLRPGPMCHFVLRFFLQLVAMFSPSLRTRMQQEFPLAHSLLLVVCYQSSLLVDGPSF